MIAIDGKTLRGTYNKDKCCGVIHMVSAFSAANQFVLRQVKTADKSNEIKANSELFEVLSLRDCLVTIDAMGCKKDVAEKIVAQEADYLLAVKGNQKRLEQVIG